MKRLAWGGAAVTLVALAYTLHPVRAAPEVFWGILVLASAAAVAAILPVRKPRGADAKRKARAAADCRRLADALTRFCEERERLVPKDRPRSTYDKRLERWRSETCRRYRDDLRSWVLRVFAEAVVCQAMSETARPLAEAPGATQVTVLRDLFRDAAETLESASLSIG